ncbi:MAG: cation:proton antiporter [Chitinophagaceae bacterium]
MTNLIIIILCVLLLLAYLFDLTATKTKIPTVLLLIFLGWICQQVTGIFNIQIPNLDTWLPLLGTIGLLLIVLEGSLELEYSKTKIPLIRNSFHVALLSIIVFEFVLCSFLHFYYQFEWKIAILNTLPLAVVSSAIAIPSAKNLPHQDREFITYESSFSDILGVIFFNFFAVNEIITSKSILIFFGQLIFIIPISIIATLFLSFLLNKINHHIKYIPIIIVVVLIYSVSKHYHLPSLLFVLLFGLILGNVNQFNNISFLKNIQWTHFENQIEKFKEITTETTFLVRAIFFMLFGYSIHTQDIINYHSLPWTLCIVITIFSTRYILFKIIGLKNTSLLYIAPRGLITILLFLSVLDHQKISFINESVIIQVILITAIIILFSSKKKKEIIVSSQEEIHDENVKSTTLEKANIKVDF